MAKKQEKKEDEVEFDLGLSGFFGGLFNGVEKIIDLAEKAEKVGGELRKEGEVRGGTKERPMRAVYGFSVRTGLGQARSRVQTFGNIKKTKQGPRVVETREPLVDVFDEKDHLLIIVELPGMNEKEIETQLNGDIFTVTASEKGKKKYYKEIELPKKIDAKTEKKTYRNGVLEVTFATC